MASINIRQLVHESIESSGGTCSGIDFASIEESLQSSNQEKINTAYRQHDREVAKTGSKVKDHPYNTGKQKNPASSVEDRNRKFYYKGKSSGDKEGYERGTSRGTKKGLIKGGGAGLLGGLAAGGIAAGGGYLHMKDRAAKIAKKVADDAAIAKRLAADKLQTTSDNLKTGNSGLGSVKSSLKSLGVDAKDYMMNHPGKVGMAAAGTAGLVGAGIAAKKYLSRRKK